MSHRCSCSGRSFVAALALVSMLIGGCQSSHMTADPPRPLAFRDAVTLDNGRVTIAVAPSVGRIVRFGRTGGDNLLWLNTTAVYDQPVLDRPGQAYYNLGGDKVWPTLQVLWGRVFGGGGWPPDGVIDGAPWTLVERSDRRVVIQSRVSPDLGVQVRRVIELADDEPRATITNTLTRVEPNIYPVLIWTVTQVQTPPVGLLDIAEDRPASSPAWLNLMKNTDFSDDVRVLDDERAAAVRLRGGRQLKVGALGRWVAGVYDDLVFLQSTSFDPRGAYPDGSSTQVYSDANYTELELLSDTVHLQPGESITNTVTWRLLDRPADTSLDEVHALIRQALAAAPTN